jgi:hypothetical protein
MDVGDDNSNTAEKKMQSDESVRKNDHRELNEMPFNYLAPDDPAIEGCMLGDSY